MSLNANQKGKRFELKIAKDLAKKFETNIRRTPNSLESVQVTFDGVGSGESTTQETGGAY